MKILLTGAAGRLATVAAPILLEAGYDVLSTDVCPVENPATPFAVADLCDFKACQRLTDGVDAVIHLGNLSHQRRASPHEGYRQNTTCNYNVFQAALDNGVRKILFASSIQVYGFDPIKAPEGQRYPGYFPLDEQTPALPRNWYALSKVAGENALDLFAREIPDLQAVSFRFPMLVGNIWRVRQHFLSNGRVNVWRALVRQEAVRLLIACLRADLPGHRNYLPVHPGTNLGLTPQQILREFFPNVPLRMPLEKITTLIDISHITQDTGWTPRSLDTILPVEDDGLPEMPCPG